MTEKTYIAIDLKSFYASVECADRGLDPLNANLVVADAARTEKTICLAVSPSLKTYGIPGRARLFEVMEKIREVNAARRMKAPGRQFTGKSVFLDELKADPGLELDLVIAPPRMAKYMEISTKIFGIYARRVAPEDIHVYSVDEVFIDATGYLKAAGMNAREFAMTLIRDVLHETGITATAGIGTNLYLSKVAMDIEAKHMQADENGVRIAELDEQSYRENLWDHRPLTDFWRVGRGIANRLESAGMRTMGDVARMSEYNEELLYSLFGVNAELLIDHAWGWEPCTIAEIHAYKPETNSVSTGQVLSHPYEAERGRLIVREMTDLLVLDLVEKCVTTDQMSLTVCYDTENLKDPVRMKNFHGPVELDRYGRKAPKDAHGSVNLKFRTSSTKIIMEAVTDLYDRIVAPGMLVRRMYVVANRLEPAGESVMPERTGEMEQLDLFTDYEALERERQKEKAELEKERKRQQAVIAIRNRFGKNAILKGMNFEEDATTRERNAQVGGHKA